MPVGSPSSPRGRMHISHEKVQVGQVYISPDWPLWADKLLNAVGAVVESDKVIDTLENLIPWGQIEIGGEGRDKPFARVPALFPNRRILALRELMKNTAFPPDEIPDFKPEPEARNLLHAAARELRTGFRRRRARSSPEVRLTEDRGESTTRFRNIMNASNGEVEK